LLSVITNISWDHTQFLGDTLQKIAAEKAGIIKPGIPVVIGERQEETTQVFLDKAAHEGAPIIFASDNEDAISLTHTEAGDWLVALPSGKSFICPLGGDYQRCNITTALHALHRIPGITLSEEVVAQGVREVIKSTGLMGRWMRVGEHPTMICDTGHNLAGITFNMGQLERWQTQHPESRLLMVIGFVADKDVDHILPLFPKDAEYFFSQAGIPRAMKAEVLAEKAATASLHGAVYGTVPEAVAAAVAKANPDDLIFIGGSTFIVADYLAAK
jgi:dihydrofolate synthase/folylpolyglutamate synthase